MNPFAVLDPARDIDLPIDSPIDATTTDAITIDTTTIDDRAEGGD